jgi:uncharacterized protein involved in exopolysaccharide biosynthesis
MATKKASPNDQATPTAPAVQALPVQEVSVATLRKQLGVTVTPTDKGSAQAKPQPKRKRKPMSAETKRKIGKARRKQAKRNRIRKRIQRLNPFSRK